MILTPQNIRPGLYPDLPNDEYHSLPGVSKTHLDDIAPERSKSPRHYWAKRLDPNREPETKSEDLITGDATHCRVFEPDSFAERFVAVPAGAPRRPTSVQLGAKNPSPATLDAIKFWSDFEAEGGGRTLLTGDQMAQVEAIASAVRSHPLARTLITGGFAEQSYFALDPETGALIKARLDYDLVESRQMIVDLKTARDASEIGFGRDATKFRYDVSCAWYPDVVDALHGRPIVQHFVIVAVEKEPPYAIGVYYAEPEIVAAARVLARRDFKAILACREAEAGGAEFAWPDFADKPRPLRINRYDPTKFKKAA